MENLSVNDTCDFFSRNFDEIVKACVPLAHPRYSKKIYMNKEALKLKNKKNHDGICGGSLQFQSYFLTFLHLNSAEMSEITY